MKNVIWKYGLLSGAVVMAMMLCTTQWFRNTGKLEGGEVFGYVGMVLAMLFVFMGIRAFRNEYRNGTITFGEACKVGGLMALISASCYVIGWLVVYEFVMPDFLDQYTQAYLAKMQATGKSEAEIQTMTTQMAQYKEWYKNPLFRIGLTFMEMLPVAVPAVLLSAAILRRKSPPVNNMSVN